MLWQPPRVPCFLASRLTRPRVTPGLRQVEHSEALLLSRPTYMAYRPNQSSVHIRVHPTLTRCPFTSSSAWQVTEAGACQTKQDRTITSTRKTAIHLHLPVSVETYVLLYGHCPLLSSCFALGAQGPPTPRTQLRSKLPSIRPHTCTCPWHINCDSSTYLSLVEEYYK